MNTTNEEHVYWLEHIEEWGEIPADDIARLISDAKRCARLEIGITEARDHFNRCLNGSRDMGSQGAYACAAEWMDRLLGGEQ